MRRNFMKKAVAVTLSAAMAFSMSAANNLKTASAATTVSLKTTFKTLEVDQVYKLKLKVNKLNWKITKATSDDKTICKATVKDNSAGNYVRLAAKSEGRTNIRVTLKSDKRKKAAKRRCKVQVVDSTTPPPATDATQPAATDATQPAATDAVVTSKVVTNQAELDAALADKTVENLEIKPAAGVENLTIGKEDGENNFSFVNLVVDAPDTTITNYGTFKNISINAISSDTWVEHAIANIIKIFAPKAHVKIGPKASVASLAFAQSGSETTAKVDVEGKVEQLAIDTSTKMEVNIQNEAAEVNVEVNEAAASSDMKVNIAEEAAAAKVDVAVKAPNTSVTLTGKAEKGNVTVSVTKAAKDAKVESSVPVEVKTHVESISVVLNAGAEGSKVQAEAGVTSVPVKNDTTEEIDVVDASGDKVQGVPVGEELTVGLPLNTEAPTTATDATTSTDATTATDATQAPTNSTQAPTIDPFGGQQSTTAASNESSEPSSNESSEPSSNESSEPSSNESSEPSSNESSEPSSNESSEPSSEDPSAEAMTVTLGDVTVSGKVTVTSSGAIATSGGAISSVTIANVTAKDANGEDVKNLTVKVASKTASSSGSGSGYKVEDSQIVALAPEDKEAGVVIEIEISATGYKTVTKKYKVNLSSSSINWNTEGEQNIENLVATPEETTS